ncbi:MAG: hypothetical protein JWQ90_3657 [Hydrocarboniphaga sp.]|uniref:hypothetical protein n=1 Tax=Hydrocarboniphaga sp. TaxID=2033016 RepID=UPI0026267173|nr:hypothetical protein [Hydrocarboniphaga sp.]MDB5971207.1 hypothetical protein [Hydrocarboniphaga sp.]
MNMPHKITQPQTRQPRPSLTIKEIDSIRELRDELMLQAHLFKAELKDRWDETETQWHQLQKKMVPLRDAAGKSGAELGSALTLLADTVRDAYQDLRNAMPR